jgi:hypothetical protein
MEKELSRRDFLRLAVLGLGVVSLGPLVEKLGAMPSLPEKEISPGQGVLFIMQDSHFQAQEIETFENAVGHRIQGISYFADMDLKIPDRDLIARTIDSGREVMINLQPRRTIERKGESFFEANKFWLGEYDSVLEKIAKVFSSFEEIPIYVRFGFEMNGSWFSWGNKPQEYPKIYRYVVDKIREGGGSNVRWIFSPNSWPSPSRVDEYYPGDDYVDLVGADFYNKGVWRILLPEDSFNKVNYYMRQIAPRKPLIVSEIGAAGPKKDEWLTRSIYENLAQGATIINYFQIDKEESWKLSKKEQLPNLRRLVGSGVFLDDSASLDEINAAIMKVH